MAPTDRLTAGSILVLALVLLTGFALVAGPTLAQETTEDGMDGNETMTDGTETMNDGNDTMDDSMATETEMGNESMTEEESMDDGSTTETMEDESMTEEESMGDGTMTEEDMGDEEMTEDDMSDEEMADETASGGQPGFGVVVGLVAIAAAAGAVLYRRRG